MNKNFQFVSVDGRHLAHSYTEQGHQFELSNFNAPMLGGDAFSEVYFRTRSGNVYHIHRPRTEFGMRGEDFVLTNARENAGKGDEAEVYTFGAGELSALVLKVGEPFVYSEGLGWTTEVTEIVPVNSPRCYVKGYFEEHNIQPSSIKDEFNAIVYGEKDPA